MTRRTALVSGASALLLAACGGKRARLLAGNPSDVRILRAALAVELAQVALYERGLALSGPADRPLVAHILEHQRAHADAIREWIKELGGSSAGVAAAQPVPRLADAGAWRRASIRAEDGWSAGYVALIPKLANQRLRATFGALATAEAEHAAALEPA